MESKKKSSVSVVIATLGHDCLERTILSLNASTIPPDEILICTPKESYISLFEGIEKNVKIIETLHSGQVFQRMIGFSVAKSTFVMQLDDDISVDYRCIEKLLFAINELGDNCAVAPAMMSRETGESIYNEESSNFVLLRKMYCWLLNGSLKCAPGTVTKAGTCIGVNPGLVSEKYFSVDWLPGGCVMHKKNNLILQNFFPYPGKAYSEDLIHSQLLKNNDIYLYICKEALCYLGIDPPIQDLNFKKFIIWIRDDMRSRKYFLRLSGKGLFRMYLYYLKQFVSYPIIRLVK